MRPYDERFTGLGEEELAQVARDMNAIAAFVGPRDFDVPSQEAMHDATGCERADVMALFGGSILAGGDVFAQAMRAGIARTYVVVGGAGHTTETFRARVRELCPELSFAGDAPEADVFASYLAARHGLAPDLLERASTNCGNNITYLLALLRDQGIDARTMILSQDASMQRRMEAELRHEAPDVLPINFATYRVRIEVREGRLAYDHEPLGMWEMGRYLTLLMGEVPRLTDDEGGYGPRGTGYLAHVDVPEQVTAAFLRLRERFPWAVRVANPAFAS